MFNLKMGVYTPDLELVGLLGGYRSMSFTENAFGSGSFLVDCPVMAETQKLLVPENIIWFREGAAGVVEYIEESSGEDGISVTAKGRLLTGLLDRRILWGRYDMTGTPAAIMARLVQENAVSPADPARRIPGLVLADMPPDPGPIIRKQKTGGSLLEALEELGEAYQVAFGIRFNPEVPQMEFWVRPGIDHSMGQEANEPVFFSTTLGDVLESEYAYNSADYRNTALVAGEGEGADRTYLTVTEGGSAEVQTADFIPQGASVLVTSTGQRVRTRSADGEAYVSIYTGPEIDEGIRRALDGGGTGTQGPKGDKGDKGDPGPAGPKGDPGEGVPTGGSAGQILMKKSSTNYDTYWTDPPESGGVTMDEVNAAIQAAVLDSWEGSY